MAEATVDLIEQLTHLRTGGSKDKPKLHKPLLVLVLLARYIRSGETSASYSDIAPDLTSLIRKYSPSESGPRAVYPFWRLQHDGIWLIDNAAEVQLHSSGDPPPKALTEKHRGTWTPAACAELRNGKANQAFEAVLMKYFAITDHEQLRRDCGLLGPG